MFVLEVFFYQVLADEHYIAMIATFLFRNLLLFFEGSRLWFIGVISGILLDVDIDEASGSMKFIVF